MVGLIRQLLLAPVFEDDAAKTRIAGVVNGILLVVLAGAVLLPVAGTIAGMKESRSITYPLSASLVLLALGLKLLLHRGYVRITGMLLSFAVWISFTIPMYVFDGIRDVSVSGYFAAIAMVSLVLGERTLLPFCVLSSLALAGAYYAETGGLISTSLGTPPYPIDLITLLTALNATALLSGITVRRMTAGFESARRNAEALRQNHQELSTLYEATTAINSDLSLDVVLRTVAEKMIQALDSGGCSLSLWDRERDLIETLIDFGTWPDETEPPGTAYDLNDYPVTRYVLETCQPVTIYADDIAADEAELALMRKQGVRTLLMLPWVARDQVMGLVELLDDAEGRKYTEKEIRLAESLAAQAAVAVENARLYEQAQREITKRGRAEEALARERNLLRTLIDNLPDHIYAKDTQSRFTIGNVAVSRLMGARASDELLGKTDFDFYPHELATEYYADEQTIIQSGQPLLNKDEVAVDQVTGKRRWLSTTKVPLQDSQGQTVGIVGIGRDVTVRKQAQEALRERMKELTCLYAVSYDIQRDLLPDELCERIIKHLVSALQFPEIAVPMIELNDKRFTTKDYTEGLPHGLHAEIRVEDEIHGHLWVYYLEERPFLIPEEQDLINGVAEALSTWLERKHAETALETERASLARRVAERTTELTRALRAKDEFLATMSHELRTPLNAILGMSEGLQEQVYGALNERQLKSLGTIERSGRRLLALINDILDMVKISANDLELVIKPVSVESVCEVSLRAMEEAVQGKRLKVTFTTDSTVEIVQADSCRLQQILVNLLENAVKFTPESGAIGLEVAGDMEREVVCFTVWDTGIGISEEEIARLFQPFVQLDSRLSRHYGGTGLGLTLAHRLTEMHGGYISVESEVGVGSRFTISLPWKSREKKENEGVEVWETEDSILPAPISSNSHNRATVLLAEDNESNLSTISDYLAARGYRVVVARDGIEAVASARETPPDVILMDIQMPEMDGLEATRTIRADAVLKDIPIVALTALAMPGDRERCVEAGANEYLSKPVDLKQLVNLIEAQLSAHTGV